jgi:hypothetical protein
MDGVDEDLRKMKIKKRRSDARKRESPTVSCRAQDDDDDDDDVV